MERKLAAILVADLVGYSRLMGRDESGTLVALKGVRRDVLDPAARDHTGRLVKAMGDGFLFEFSSAVGAVECAAEIQRRMAIRNAGIADDRRMMFRIGINVGDVISDAGDVFGDGVNVAARLEAIAAPGGVCLSRAARDQVRDRLAYAFEDLGERELKNIVRPVRVFRLVIDAAEPPASSASAVAFAARPAVAVLPFDDMGNDPAESYFVDGLTEDVITALSYWRWFPVIARNSTLAYKGKKRNAIDIGRELGAAYLVEGSARRAGERVRITVQLTDATSGLQLWAERYDREIADVFALQEEIAERVVVHLAPELQRAEAQRASRKHPRDLGAWDLALQAATLQDRMTRSGHAEARRLLELALTTESDAAYAWSMLSLCHYHEGILGWAEDRGEALRRSLEAGERAAAIDERDWLAQALVGMGRLWTARDHEAALEGQERAVALNPSAPLARHFLACVLEFSGRMAEAIPHLHAMLRVDPRYRFTSLALADEALCHFLLGDADSARICAEKAVRLQPGNIRARQRLAAALAALGRDGEARAAATELLVMQPDLDVAYVDSTYPFRDAADRIAFLEALRRAGLEL